MSFMLTFVTVALVAIALGFLTQGLKHYNQRRSKKTLNAFASYISETSQLSDHLK
ncbi:MULTISPECIES: hypothetical protein [Hydrogenovibrio]|jgi:hypothetical protein|uniref:hypothetical protein n=1 Tax=Hydrogenovibrio TaxID=28884 RepID=UPI001256F105|nr:MULTISPECIES: hypothetical protein [Hydrogenovibrio]MBD3821009.1 hypothetical protein [Thiotrichales bacterium]MBN2607425.1 hypothetical protein [Thiotrichales bacterium]BBN60025.1 hypothetical protein HVMH_1619 [Hydrogenovibrio marinus]